jgi:hypothetical protein
VVEVTHFHGTVNVLSKIKKLKNLQKNLFFVGFFKVNDENMDSNPYQNVMDPQHWKPVLRIRIHRIHVFLGLQDTDPDTLVRGMDPDPDPALDPDPSIIMKK